MQPNAKKKLTTRTKPLRHGVDTACIPSKSPPPNRGLPFPFAKEHAPLKEKKKERPRHCWERGLQDPTMGAHHQSSGICYRVVRTPLANLPKSRFDALESGWSTTARAKNLKHPQTATVHHMPSPLASLRHKNAHKEQKRMETERL